ncbi:MAG: hypothetical protein ABJP45_06845 [Cyclobacteriaceae bacterium]
MYTPISEFDKSLLNATEAYIHHASQFLAMVGKNYLEDQSDDSNANLNFNPSSSRIECRAIGDFQVNLNVPDWQLEIKKGEKVQNSFSLTGQLKSEIFEWLRREIEEAGLDAQNLKYIDHYEVAEHEVDMGQPFQELNIDLVSSWLAMRANANVILSDLNQIAGIHSEVRIWPHHFDTGTYYELAEKKAIGAGWAIADTLCDNPYLYIYGWDGNKELDYSAIPDLVIGKWIVTEGWQGAVIESVELSTSTNQYNAINSFMNTVFNFLKAQLT